MSESDKQQEQRQARQAPEEASIRIICRISNLPEIDRLNCLSLSGRDLKWSCSCGYSLDGELKQVDVGGVVKKSCYKCCQINVLYVRPEKDKGRFTESKMASSIIPCFAKQAENGDWTCGRFIADGSKFQECGERVSGVRKDGLGVCPNPDCRGLVANTKTKSIVFEETEQRDSNLEVLHSRDK